MSVFRSKILRRFLLAALVAGLATGIYFQLYFPGLVRGSIRQMRYATWHENRNLAFLLDYWLGFVQKLTVDPATQTYNFNHTPQTGLSDFEKGRLAYHRGAFAQAVSLIDNDVRAQGESETKLFWLAMCYMRRAEAENCLPALLDRSNGHEHGAADGAEHLPDHLRMCTLPLTAFHRKAESAAAAARLFERLLEGYDSRNRLYQWLLNFNYMTLGKFPDGVPAKYRINTSFIDKFYGKGKEKAEAENPDLSFQDMARQLGVNTLSAGRGVAVEDFDKDGYLDVVTGGNFGPLQYFKNDRGRGFTDRTEASGLGGVRQVFAIIAVDYDNDGWVDLFVGRPFSHYALFRNNGNGSFSDVTAASGLWDGLSQDEIAATWLPTWFDVNNDGKLDVFISQWAFALPLVSGVMAKPRMDSALFVNEGGHFVNRTKEYGLTRFVRDYYYIGSTAGDYDGDGFPDLFLSSPLRHSSILLHNVAGKRFEDPHLVSREASGFASSFVDVNHDGRLDIFVAGFGDATTAVEQVVFGENTDKFHCGHSAILLQRPDGRFEDHEDVFDMPMSTMGSSFGDIDNDGCIDFYLGTGNPEGWFILPNLMYMGERRGTACALSFRNVSMLQGLGTIQKGHGIVFFDFNEDGRQDIYSSLGGMWPGDAWPSQLLVNQSRFPNTWTKIRLRGRRTNYFGLGATIKVVAENERRQEIVRYHQVDNKTGFGSGPFLAHIGLMDANRIRGVEVRWPVSGCTKTYAAELGRLNVLDEADCTPAVSRAQ